jgi:arsenite oxidase small subunit
LRLTKRDLLKLLLSLSGVAVLAMLVPLIEFLSYGSKAPIERKKIINISDLNPHSAIIFQWPSETHPYDTNLLIRGREGLGMGTKGDLYAYNRVCTHLQCLVNYDPQNDQLVCPCHGSVFAGKDGNVVNGPARKALPTIEVDEEENGDIYAKDIVGEIGVGR